jgi:tRNA pseudouridine55 synthase
LPEGFLVLDKPSGVTSHDMVAAVRRAVGVRKVGHAGTLDPMATGALVVAVGRVTRLIRFIQPLTKEYVAFARFGVATDTLDADGQEVWRQEMPVSAAEVEAATRVFIGDIDQVPPMVSAIKMKGKRLYQLAREGKEIERPARRVTVHSLRVHSFEGGPYPLVGLRVECGKGVYVRSLADDLARQLEGRAHLVSLRRLRVGSLAVGEDPGSGCGPEELERWDEWMLSPADGLCDMASWTVGASVLEMVRNGRRIPTEPASRIESEKPTRILDEEGRLRAVYRRSGDMLIPEVVLN